MPETEYTAASPASGSESDENACVASARATAISTCALSRRFGKLVAVDQVLLSVLRGEIFGLIGSNGAGKSTLIKMLTTLLPPSSGAARIAGFNIITQPSRVRRSIGYVSQMLSADGTLTGYQNLVLSARLYVIPRRERAERIAEALAMMNLTKEAGRQVQHYSGGMIRRLEIAQSILHRPEVLLMDEPTVGLDPMARRTVRERLLFLSRKFGMSIFISPHDMSEAEDLCERVAILHRGRIAVVGTPTAVKAQVGPGATLEDAFAHFIGGLEAGDGYKEARQARRSAQERS